MLYNRPQRGGNQRGGGKGEEKKGVVEYMEEEDWKEEEN